MKRLWLCLCLLSIILVSVTSSQIISENNEISFTGGTFTLPENSHVLFEKSIDLNGDKKEESVYVYGEKGENDYTKNINIAVVNEQGILRRTSCNGIDGNEEKVVTEDFNGDGVKDIFVSVKNGENALCMVGDFSHSIPKNIMLSSNLKGLLMKTEFVDGFKISSLLENGQNFGINIEKQKQTLIEKGIYNSDGKFLKGKARLSMPVDIKAAQGMDAYNIVFVQKLLGNDSVYLCTVETVMEYNDDTLLINSIEYYQ